MGETEKRIETHRIKCLSKVKMFLLALTCAYVSKTLSGSYMNSMLTQVERQFNIPTSLVGFINGSFEIGNLLLIIFVSYFGTKLHRPIMIGVGCVVMGLGCFLISLPHFLMNRYEYESTVSVSSNLSSNSFLCMENGNQTSRPTQDPSECVKEVKSLMWVYVLVGNIIRGMGETPIMPLGISYIEDFAKSENSPLYIGFIETGAIIGPLIGLLLASFCANIYVDTGSVNTDTLTITPTDTRWVGAWWFGFLICAGVNVLTAIPFFFLPKTLPKEGLEGNADIIKNDKEEKQRGEVKKEKNGITKDFLPFMKSLSCNPIYMLFILISVLQFNAFASMFSFMPKYLEQQYGKSTSDAIFLIGIYNLPPICIGYIAGGLIMKKFKITVKQAAHIGCWLSVIEYLLYFLCFLATCDNSPVAGITTSYAGIQQDLYVGNKVLDDCNRACNCPTKTWDPVCGDNDLSYMSACLAGCETSSGTGLNMVFQNCSCIRTSGNSSAVLGLCDKGHDCSMMLQYFLILSTISSFIYSLAAIPGYMVLLRCIKSEEKSLGVGLHAFCTRIFAGIPAPIYFGALVDSTCLHWGTLKCGKPGACRIYDSTNFRHIYLGLPAALRGLSFIPAFLILILLRKRHLPGENDLSGTELAVTKITEKEKECKDVQQNSKVLNDEEMKTKL
ncbi:solute carrier organic anion transporter family member 1A2 isoform X1 [Ictidomys tridecemlineatus]|uniref:solute carrier organic anion transporter family member 1A2 isoform X1 n=2 Tax=Ictidomys tridecemlineatus TaxID=43179 RepID=UPI00038BCDAF|nr:solute carrier organic anion transporter family member 1A2 isoform X1 [Ictidomys tridecemlineatus]XP_040136864.1 solute carrier organic anion transporter family member 1A2 isoform X1 [Ictidomys tridecemlineatus]XP_040136865.1 solute carrier organic anion transporter family member 1A2 isoform X1 [Ictidomys tridecemlineatus]XP_040136866.1 solute carrier organic anion transporter family member 1A2 isoform X1 [Ictidomys tridecemlineatus]XP_040136867.1 solute carrier organic anion transporter fam